MCEKYVRGCDACRLVAKWILSTKTKNKKKQLAPYLHKSPHFSPTGISLARCAWHLCYEKLFGWAWWDDGFLTSFWFSICGAKGRQKQTEPMRSTEWPWNPNVNQHFTMRLTLVTGKNYLLCWTWRKCNVCMTSVSPTTPLGLSEQ